jgi:hypothetical protein
MVWLALAWSLLDTNARVAVTCPLRCLYVALIFFRREQYSLLAAVPIMFPGTFKPIARS